MVLHTTDTDQIALLLKEGKIGVLPTDTIYGLHCLAKRSDLIDKVSDLKGREKTMPMITAISSEDDLSLFGIEIGEFEKDLINKYWPGPNTLIFDTKDGSTRSFRVPDNSFLISVLKKTGPLISTSANPHEMPFSKDITQAIEYFGDKVDFYVDGGELNNPPSSVYKISKGEVTKIR
jgi:L-threonylcarbamoyladenylate synthase